MRSIQSIGSILSMSLLLLAAACVDVKTPLAATGPDVDVDSDADSDSDTDGPYLPIERVDDIRLAVVTSDMGLSWGGHPYEEGDGWPGTTARSSHTSPGLRS